MKVVILAGGFGTRISEETQIRPKPMIEIGNKPILWHILKIYSHFNINEFIICCGFKGYLIKEYFANYFLHTSDITLDIANDKIKIHSQTTEPWKITLVDTGENTMTGGRLKRVKKYIDDDHFCLTYGDGLADINIDNLINSHFKSGKEATITAVKPPGRFGSLNIKDNNNVISFLEKPDGDGGWINGGFFVLNSKVIDRIEDDNTIWEQDPLISLAQEKQLNAYKHKGFWRPMDTLRDKTKLEELWQSKKAPWKLWK